jgi:Fe-S-cluster containining protein
LCCGDTENRDRTILLMKIEASDIAEKTSMRLKEFAEKIEDCEPYIYKMKKTEKGKCIFLRDDLCTIYSVRPLICRFYPFQLKSSENGKHSFMCTGECVGIGQGPELNERFFEKLFTYLTNQMERNLRAT